MYQSILDTPKQFSFNPKIIYKEKLKKFSGVIVAGMGGSALAAGVLKLFLPETDITVHKNYDLPPLSPALLKSKLIVLSSYSGNTEETISAYLRAKELKLNTAVITTGGRLLKLAQTNKTPYILLPDFGIQPRTALTLNLLALLKITAQDKIMSQLQKFGQTFRPQKLEIEAKKLSRLLLHHVPVIYSSAENEIIAYFWKIILNETGKNPAFFNLFPELNHNEMNSFDIAPTTKSLSQNFHFLFLRDPADNPRIKKRFDITQKLYRQRKLPVTTLTLKGKNIYEKFFNSMILAQFTAYFLATANHLESEQVPMVEQFKKML